MNREAQSVLMLMLGGALLRISAFSDAYLRYVKAGLRWPLIAAGTVLVCGALITLAREFFGWGAAATAEDDLDDEHDHGGHGHGHGGPLVGWLLLLPVFTIVLVGPPSLGSYAANRSGATAVARPSADFPPLPAGDPVRVSLLDYVTRSVWEDGASMRGRDLRLTGFVTNGAGGRTYLTRIALTCCAADGQALRIVLRGQLPGGLAADTWITVTGRYDPGQVTDPVSRETVPTLAVTGLRRVAVPSEPYDQ